MIPDLLCLYAENQYSSLETLMKGFDKVKLLQLATDEPNVNWNSRNILDDKLKSENFPKTLNIGSCAQHTVHAAFKNGF